MPEIKRNFLQGKMNKDLDERLVPNGQYRDALNIEVSTSEDSNVGSVQSILGNKHMDNYPSTSFPSSFFPTNPECIGSISDEKTDSLYWLVTGDKLITPHYHNNSVAGSPTPFYQKDMILRHRKIGSKSSPIDINPIEPILVDIQRVLLDSSGVSGNGPNTIALPNLNNISVGMTVVGLEDTGTGFNTLFSTTVTQLGAFVAENVGWTANYSWVTQPNPSANPNNPFQVTIEGILDDGPPPPAPQTYSPVSPPTLLIYAQYPGQWIGIGNVVSGFGIQTGTTVTNVVYPSSHPGNIEVTIDQTPSVSGPYPWGTQVNFINPSSTIQVQVLNNVITIPGANYNNAPSDLGILVGMEVIDPCIPVGTTVVSIDETTSTTESYITLSNAVICGGGLMNVLGGALTSEITVADTWPPDFDPALSNYPDTDYLYFYRTPVLNFDKDRLITGLNIIDDMLFWTDNWSEPKKINIERSWLGTDPSGTQHTNLICEPRDINNSSNTTSIEERHITVIKKPPTNPPILHPQTYREVKGHVHTAYPNIFHPNGILVSAGDYIYGVKLIVSSSEGSWQPGDIVLFQEQVANVSFPLPANFTIKAELLNVSQDPNGPPGTYVWQLEILWVNPLGTSSPTGWDAMKDTSDKQLLFEFKFPRFATRYKYEDNEYSSFSPFSEVCFVPGEFQYKPKEGYNLGMENTVTSILLKDLVPKNIPKDVVQVDILYKESNSPNIYIVDSIKPDDTVPDGKINNDWNDPGFVTGVPQGSSTGTYEITSDTLYAAIPANQLLRPWDNVPRMALAQEVTANRVVYGNYLQNYNLNRVDNTEFKADFRVSLKSYSPFANDFKSLKSQREYQIGVTYFDEYGRETPILTSKSGTIKIPKRKCNVANRLNVKNLKAPPSFATAYKYYIKENSNEYYNLAMDRFYDADDGNVWISFYSYDRNKIDDETWIELKKTVDGVAVKEDAKYKVLAIKNEAPDYIKTTRKGMLNLVHDAAATNLLFDDNNAYPIEDRTYFSVGQDALVGGPAEKFNELDPPLRIRLRREASNIESKWYDIESVELIPTGSLAGGSFMVNLKGAFGADVDFVDSTTSGVLETGIALELTQGELVNKPEFDGRFFVKILKDNRLKEHIITQSNDTTSLVTVGFEPLYFFDQTVMIDSTGATTDYWTGSNGGLPINYTGSEFYYMQSGTCNNYADDFNVCKNKWRYFFGTGSSQVPGSTGGPKWIIDRLGYAGKMPVNTVYNGWLPGNTTGLDKPEVTSISMNGSTKHTVGASGDGVNGKYIDISFVGIDQKTTLNSAMAPVWQHYFDVGGFKGNTMHAQEALTVSLLETVGQRFKFEGDDEIYKIVNWHATEIFNLMTTLTKFPDLFPNSGNPNGCQGDGTFYHLGSDYYDSSGGASCASTSDWYHQIGYSSGECKGFPNRRKTWRLEVDKVIGANGFNPENHASYNSTCAIVFLDDQIDESDETRTTNPAIWETEPKPTTDIDLFFEASNVIPITLDKDWDEQVLRPGMIVATQGSGNTLDAVIGQDVVLTNIHAGNILLMNANSTNSLSLADNSILKFWTGNEYISVAVEGAQTGQYQGIAMLKIDPNFYNGGRTLPWFNCYSFGNGVESNRIRDDYNAITIDKGPTASTVSPELYKEERRKHGLIYSGLYNSNSGINNLNQFIQAEKITKDLNPTYGSIQKLFARRISLVAFCEDRVVRILSNKDALYNADGNMQLTSTNKVLGEAQPFEGDYGISKSPESFAKESYRAYFADKSRGVVLRLSKDGLTPISEYGMSDYFKDNLKLGDKLIGGFDDRKNEYNLTIKTSNENETPSKTISFTEAVKGWTSFKSFIPESSTNLSSDYYTFKNAKLYKHCVPLRYDFNNSSWIDSDEENAANYNVFYEVNSYDSSVKLILNDEPSSIKSFKTLNYEGSQSKVDKFTTTTAIDAAGNTLVNIGDGDFYNLAEDIDPLTGLGIGYISGWHVSSIITDEQEGSVKEFIDKENKWYNYILGKPKTDIDIDAEEFSFQGIGLATPEIDGQLIGCMDPTALNYNPNANFACNGCCIDIIYGCTDPTATNYDPLANQDDGSCFITGCTDSLMFNFNPLATIPCCTVCDGSDPNSCCIPIIFGCTDPTMFNFNNYGSDPAVGLPLTGDPLIDVNTLDGSCIPIAVGCTDPLASNFNPGANTPCGGNNSCCIYPPIPGCTDPLANNYDPTAQVDDGSCTYNTGCMDDGAMGQTWWDTNYGSPTTYPGTSHPGAYPLSNYDITAVVEDGSCIYPTGCTDPTMLNYDPAAVIDDGSCIAIVYGCMDGGTTDYTTVFGDGADGIIANNYNASANVDDGSCTYDVLGCTDPLAINYDPLATIDDGSCVICANININWYSLLTDPTSPNYNNGTIEVGHNAPTDDLINNYMYNYALVDSSGTAWVAGYGTGGGGFMFTNLPGGTYTITVTTDAGCTDTSTVTLVDQLIGCMDSNANNYSASALTEDGSCLYSGCLDPASTNGITTFNHPNPGAFYTNPISATHDCNDILGGNDYSCCSYILGCTDPTATNYDPLANQDDGSCYWNGCTDLGANNYNSSATVDDGSCEYWGCLDATALNYDGCTDGSGTSISCTHDCNGNITSIDTSCCTYCDSSNALLNTFSSPGQSGLVGSFSSATGDWDGELTIVNSAQNNTITWNNTYIYANQISGAFNPAFFSSGANLVPNASATLTDLPPGTYEATVEQDNGCTQVYTTTISEIIYGCMDALASNYDANATNQSDGATTYNYTGTTNTPVDDCTYSSFPCCDVVVGTGFTTVNAVNGVNGEINNITAYNYNCPQGTYGWADYTIVVTGPNGYTNTLIYDGTTPLSLTGLSMSNPYATANYYWFTATDSNPSGPCTSLTWAVVLNNDTYGCTDPAASNYNSQVNNDDGSCTYACNLAINPIQINPGACGDDGSFGIQGVTGNNAVTSYDFEITPNPSTGTGSYVGTNSSGMNNFWNPVNDGTYTLDVYEGSSGPGFPVTGCSATITFTMPGPVLGCLDPNANNYDPTTTCDASQQDYCCYTISAVASLPSGAPTLPPLLQTTDAAAASPPNGSCDASVQLDIIGLPAANALSQQGTPGGANVEYRISGYGTASGYSGMGSGGAFTALAPTGINSPNWSSILMGNGDLCEGSYLLEVHVNHPQNSNNTCATYQQWITITPG